MLSLTMLVAKHRLWQQDKSMTLLLLSFAGLMVLNAVLPATCQPDFSRACLAPHSFGTNLHAILSGLSATVIALATLLDIRRRKKPFSFLFLAIQIVFLISELSFAGDTAFLLIIQYVYETAMLLWVLNVLEGYKKSEEKFTYLMSKPYRTVLSVWIGLSGIFEIITAFGHHHITIGTNVALTFHPQVWWVAQQTAFIGVLMIYLARQVYTGQRRAAYILLAIFGFELYKYSLIQPKPILATLFCLTFIMLFLSRGSFVRNSAVVMRRRYYDALIVIGGVLCALAVVVIVLLAFGKLGHAINVLDGGTDFAQRGLTLSDHHLDSLHGEHLRQVTDVLLATTTAVLAWIVFRPKRFDERFANKTENKRRAEILLGKFSQSSEDYFKLWPHDKSYFFAPDGNSFIAYKVARGCAFALANPTAPSLQKRRQLLDRFVDYCTANGWSVCFLMIDEDSKAEYESRLNLQAFGSSAVINIQEFNEKTRHDKWWRWKTNQALREGFEYAVSQPPHSAELLKNLKSVSDIWLNRKGRREFTFAQGYFDKDYMNDCRIHYLTDSEGKIVAFTNEIPVFSGSQTTIDLLRYMPDRKAAMPFLLMSVIEQLGKEEQFSTFDLGFVPLAQLDSRALQALKSLAGVRFSATGLEQFKNKFRPEWAIHYMAYSGDVITLANLALSIESALKYEP